MAGGPEVFCSRCLRQGRPGQFVSRAVRDSSSAGPSGTVRQQGRPGQFVSRAVFRDSSSARPAGTVRQQGRPGQFVSRAVRDSSSAGPSGTVRQQGRPGQFDETKKDNKWISTCRCHNESFQCHGRAMHISARAQNRCCRFSNRSFVQWDVRFDLVSYCLSGVDLQLVIEHRSLKPHMRSTK